MSKLKVFGIVVILVTILFLLLEMNAMPMRETTTRMNVVSQDVANMKRNHRIINNIVIWSTMNTMMNRTLRHR